MLSTLPPFTLFEAGGGGGGIWAAQLHVFHSLGSEPPPAQLYMAGLWERNFRGYKPVPSLDALKSVEEEKKIK